MDKNKQRSRDAFWRDLLFIFQITLCMTIVVVILIWVFGG